jgi:cytoskeletal protein RodZ
MRTKFHVSTSSRLPVFCCLVSILLAALACARPNTNASNDNARNANSSQPSSSVTVTTPESATNGQIEVASTPPGAMIILMEMNDGVAGAPQVKGSTPATISVKPGTYTVHLERAGNKPYQKEVKVEANKTARLNARLPRA